MFVPGLAVPERFKIMFITVRYGNNEALVCNPTCAVVNLLASIKRRAGFSNSGVLLDLSDESGLVKELDTHRYDYANKYLSSHATYVLVEKQAVASDEHDSPILDGSSSPNIQYQYIPLLDNYSELLPNYRLHVQQVDKKRKGRNASKSPSPAGVRGTKGKKAGVGSRAPSRRK